MRPSSRPSARPLRSEALHSRALTLPAVEQSHRRAVACPTWSRPCCRQSLQRWACWR